MAETAFARLQISARKRLTVPFQHLCCLLSHNLNFSISEGHRPRERTECVGTDGEHQQTPERHGNIAVKIYTFAPPDHELRENM